MTGEAAWTPNAHAGPEARGGRGGAAARVLLPPGTEPAARPQVRWSAAPHQGKLVQGLRIVELITQLACSTTQLHGRAACVPPHSGKKWPSGFWAHTVATRRPATQELGAYLASERAKVVAREEGRIAAARAKQV